MPKTLKTLGVHGLGDHRTSDWKEKWTKSLKESFPGGVALDCQYVTYDDIFEKTRLTAWECAKALWKLTASGVSSLGRRERGVLSDFSDRIQWTAGYVVASGSPLLDVYHARTGKHLRRFEGHTAPITSLAVSPDGKLLLTLGKEGGGRDPEFFFQPNDVLVVNFVRRDPS